MSDFETHKRGTASELNLLRSLARACYEAEAWEQKLPVDVHEALSKLKYFYRKVENAESL